MKVWQDNGFEKPKFHPALHLAVALDEAVCVACGDGVVSGPPYGAETCDAGALPAMPALFSGA